MQASRTPNEPFNTVPYRTVRMNRVMILPCLRACEHPRISAAKSQSLAVASTQLQTKGSTAEQQPALPSLQIVSRIQSPERIRTPKMHPRKLREGCTPAARNYERRRRV